MLQRTLIFSLLFIFASEMLAEDNARLPYEHVYQMQKIQARLSRSYTNLQVIMRMASTRPEVKSSDLKMFIESKKGNLPLKIEADGAFKLPMQEDLLDENPWIVVNQPKGTMALHWNVGFSSLPDITNPVRYRRLMESVKNAEDLQDEMARTFPGTSRLTFNGLKLIFREPKDKGVVIHAKSGDRVLKVENREIFLLREAELLEQNPEVELPAIPEKIELTVRKD